MQQFVQFSRIKISKRKERKKNDTKKKKIMLKNGQFNWFHMMNKNNVFFFY